jgi:hypothetical protein
MALIIIVLAFLTLALAAPRFGADTRSGREWSVGALMQPKMRGSMKR